MNREELIEAGEAALRNFTCPCDDDRCDCPDLSQDAQTVVAATEPLIRAQIAADIEARRQTCPLHWPSRLGCVACARFDENGAAARIARGDS